MTVTDLEIRALERVAGLRAESELRSLGRPVSPRSWVVARPRTTADRLARSAAASRPGGPQGSARMGLRAAFWHALGAIHRAGDSEAA